jgi:signal transduction histidine kinase
MRKQKLLWGLVLMALVQFHFTYSQPIILATDEADDIVINPHAYLFREKTAGINEIDKVRTAPDSAFFRNTRFQEINYGFSQPSGWCKFTIKNTTDHNSWILKVHQSRVDTVQLYVQRKNGELIRYPLTGHFQSIKERAFYSLHFAHPISIAKNETIVCYLFTQRKFARHAAILSLQKENYYRNYDTRFIIFISALVGVSVLAILIGMVLFFFLYEKVYIYYSIYCFSFLLLVSADTGFLYAFFNDIAEQKLVNNLSMVFYYWIVGWHILFTMELLEIKKHPQRWMYWVGLISGSLCCMVSLILLMPIPDLLRSEISQWSYYIVFFLDAYILYTMISQLAKREVVVYFYMAGFLFTLIAASILMLADLNLIEGINQKTDIFFIAPVIEILCMVIGLGINSSRHVKEKLKAQIQLNETQNQIITVQEDERRRIAQDLHDDVGNSLAAVKNMLVQHKEPVLIEREIDNIIQDIRNISHDLMPVDFEAYALTDIIRQTVNKFKGHPDIQFEYDQTGSAVKLKPVTELVVYRILNELITNSIKHSRATEVMIQLIYQKESLVVMVEDNGIGLNHNNGDPEKGIGLKNIRHRIAYIKATLTLESDHKGTLAIIEIPYEERI